MMIMSVYNPAYGLADDTRYQVLIDAEEHGPRAAALMHNVSTPSIYRWRKEMTMKPAKETTNG